MSVPSTHERQASLRRGQRPWYRDGLRFECTGCGDCCTGEPGHVWVNKAEIEALAEALGLEVEAFEKKCVRQVGVRKSLTELPNGDCVLLDGPTRRCTVYGLRPRQCRSWPFWHSNLRTRDRWEETGRSCPGIGRGPLVPLSEIEAQAALVRI